MSAQYFQCQTHTAPCQHIRHYPRATSTSQEEGLRVEVKQYTPLDNLQPTSGDVTIIAAHAVGFPKETYEPLFDDLLERLHNDGGGVRIRSIWIADVATSGGSAILNEGKLGNDPSWFDWARDILLMVNHFADEMPRPLVGFGHSMGGTAIVNTALMHPRLFTTLILYEPIISRTHREMKFAAVHAIATKKDHWPSRAAAAEWARNSPLLKTFDPRVLDCFIKHGFRDLPTLLYPDLGVSSTGNSAQTTSTATPVTLAITRHHDASSFARPTYLTKTKDFPDTADTENKHTDTKKLDRAQQPFYRPEAISTFAQLPFLKPTCFYMYGDKSPFSSASPTARADKLETTGTGKEGSGGHAQGAVGDVLLKGTGHFAPFERPAEVAAAIVPWLQSQLRAWKAEEDAEEDARWKSKGVRERSMLSEEYLLRAKKYVDSKRKTERGGETKKANL